MDTSLITNEYVIATADRRWSIRVKRTGRQHWNGPCPVCGGKDRLFIQKTGYVKCNQCTFFDWLDSDQERRTFDPYEIIRRAEEQKKREAEEHERRWRDWTNGFLAGFYWREWHDRMTQEHIDWWLSQGITKRQIDYYELGFNPQKTIYHDGKDMLVGAYTIPVRDLDKWQICNMHYRLANPPEGVQKYRYEHGIPAREFYASPKRSKCAIVVEGAKKAMVVYRYIKGACQVVGLTSCSPSQEMLERLRIFGDIVLMLDPGTEKQSRRIASVVSNVRVCELPGKPDDLLLAGMTVREMKSYIPKRSIHV